MKWVIQKLCEAEVVLKIENINIKSVEINEKPELLVKFNAICNDHKYMYMVKASESRVDVEVLYEDVVLRLGIENGRLYRSLKEKGTQKTLSSTDGNTGGTWSLLPPFIEPSTQGSNADWGYMTKIIENIILEKI